MKKSKIFFWVACSTITIASNAQIIYTDVSPDETFGMDQMYLLDMDNDGTDDYIIEQVDSLIAGNPLEGVQLRSIGSFNEAVYEVGTLTFLSGIPLNDVIDGTQQWTVPSPSLPAGGIITIGTTPYPAGDWIDGQDHYGAVRFTTGPNQYYGWVRFSITTDGLSFTIKDYAYHSIPDQALLAGAVVDGVQEINLSGFEMYEQNGVFTIKNDVSKTGMIKIYSISGVVVKEINLDTESTTIDLNLLPFGVYIIHCENELGESVFKVDNLK